MNLLRPQSQEPEELEEPEPEYSSDDEGPIYNKMRQIRHSIRFRRLKLGVMLILVLVTQALFTGIFGGWQHWKLLLKADGSIRDGCTGYDTVEEVDSCEESLLSTLYVVASSSDNLNALVGGIILDWRGGYYVVSWSWTSNILGAILICFGSLFHVTSVHIWRLAFYFWGSANTQFNLGFGDFANNFPAGLRFWVLTVIVAFQMMAPLTVRTLYMMWSYLGQPPLWKLVLTYYCVAGIPLFALYLLLFRIHTMDNEILSIVTGRLTTHHVSTHFASLVSFPLGRSPSRTSLAPGSLINSTEIQESPDPRDDTYSLEELELFRGVLNRDGPMYLDGDHAQGFRENFSHPKPLNETQKFAYESRVQRSKVQRIGDSILKNVKAFCKTEVLICAFAFYVPQAMGKEFYWVNLMVNTSESFATEFSFYIPFFALTTIFTGGPLYQLKPPYGMIIVMILTVICQQWSHLSVLWNGQAGAVWSGAVCYASTTTLITTARFIYIRWVLKTDYGAPVGFSALLAGLAQFVLLFLTANYAGVKKAFEIFYRYIYAPLAITILLGLIGKHYYDDHYVAPDKEQELVQNTSSTGTSIWSHGHDVADNISIEHTNM